MPVRWNSKIIKNSMKADLKDFTEKEKRMKNNATKKFINTFKRISLHNNGISFFSGIDNLLAEIFDVKEQNNELINDIIKLTKNIR